MKLENQVVSLGLAKEIKELGVKQESYFSWVNHKRGPQACASHSVRYSKVICSAFTVAELGEILPILVKTERKKDCFMCYGTFKKGLFKHRAFMKTIEADARAKMLIYLIKNKLVELKK